MGVNSRASLIEVGWTPGTVMAVGDATRGIAGPDRSAGTKGDPHQR